MSTTADNAKQVCLRNLFDVSVYDRRVILWCIMYFIVHNEKSQGLLEKANIVKACLPCLAIAIYSRCVIKCTDNICII